MAHDFDIRYDRRLTPEFLAHFCEGGFASSLAKITESGLYPLDLRARRDARSGAEHVTLYTGLTAVLQVLSSKNGTIRLAAHSTHQKQGTFDKAWQAARTVDEWTTLWPEVELYLERVIPAASQSHGRTEGAVQAAIGSYRDDTRIVLDREVTPSFRDAKLKRKVMDECRDPILAALKAADLGFSGMPKTLGNECDALAISSDGTLEAIEVKPLRGGSIAWVAAQALMYSRLMSRWVEYVADEPDQVPGRVLREMSGQRAAMGLAPWQAPTLPDRPTVVPVVAVQRGASPMMVSRMLAVRDALAASEHGFPRVTIFEVSLIGR